MSKYLGIAAMVGLVGIGLFVIYKGFENKLAPVKEATPEAKFNREVVFTQK